MKQIALLVPDDLYEEMRAAKGGDSFATYIITLLEKELRGGPHD